MYRMIEHHENGALDVLVTWSTNLKSICFRRGVRSMPLTRIESFYREVFSQHSNKPQQDDCRDRRDLCPVRSQDFERTRRIYAWLCLDRIYWSPATQKLVDEQREKLLRYLHRPSNDLQHASPNIELVRRPSQLHPNRTEQGTDDWWIFVASSWSEITG